MLTDEQKTEVMRAFVLAVFVGPNATATINCDQIRAEITAICTDIDGGSGTHVPEISGNLEWSTVLADLIGAKL